MRRLLIPLIAAAVSIAAGAVLFAAAERLPVTTGLYWAVTTASTVGYGDVLPRTGTGRLVTVLVMLTAIPSLGAAFAALASIHVARRLGPRHQAALAEAKAARQIAADTYRHVTSRDHALAPAAGSTGPVTGRETS